MRRYSAKQNGGVCPMISLSRKDSIPYWADDNTCPCWFQCVCTIHLQLHLVLDSPVSAVATLKAVPLILPLRLPDMFHSSHLFISCAFILQSTSISVRCSSLLLHCTTMKIWMKGARLFGGYAFFLGGDMGRLGGYKKLAWTKKVQTSFTWRRGRDSNPCAV